MTNKFSQRSCVHVDAFDTNKIIHSPITVEDDKSRDDEGNRDQVGDDRVLKSPNVNLKVIQREEKKRLAYYNTISRLQKNGKEKASTDISSGTIGVITPLPAILFVP